LQDAGQSDVGCCVPSLTLRFMSSFLNLYLYSRLAEILMFSRRVCGMIEIEKPKIETVETSDDASYGKFVVEPLERGCGTTLGNTLRRILLSSLPGSAVTSVQIDNVLHEFSTIDGVMEDVTAIILNIKNLAMKLYADEEKTLEIDVQGEGKVTAADIIHDSDVE